ncbi:hypothetical protein EV175_000667 [Coemansia sp. RSA 1933]|nr:hypothetical protein EV175_000667 [Coemansia sp. RSA 1933]
MSNTAISATAMQAVLEQLPQMSGQIVDDTRHEKVLSYMRLFLEWPDALDRLREWDALQRLSECLQQSSDSRVSAVAIRFVGDCVGSPGGHLVWQSLVDEPYGKRILDWVVENVDSRHALVRFSCVYFVRMVVGGVGSDDPSVLAFLGEQLDYPRYIMRRLLDSGSYFVVAEACRLLGTLIHSGKQPDGPLSDLVRTLVARPFAAQSAARKLAVLAVISTLYGTDHTQAHALARHVLPLDRLAPYLFDTDRLVRDRALDVLENTLRLADGPGCQTAAIRVLDTWTAEAPVGPRVRAVIALRMLAAIVKQTSGALAVGIVSMALTQLCAAYDVEAEALSNEELAGLAGVDGLLAPLIRAHAAVACEAARVVREYCCCGAHDLRVARALLSLLDRKRVQANAQLLHLVVESLVGTMQHEELTHVLALPAVVSNFAVRAPGLHPLFELARNVIALQDRYDAKQFGVFCTGLRRAVGERLVDVEWEARDCALEFVTTVVRTVEWSKARCLLVPADLVDGAALALDDPEEYVRASAALLLAAAADHATDAVVVQTLATHKRLEAQGLNALLSDSEAFVVRAALELVCSLGVAAAAGQVETHAWLQCLSYSKLYQLAEHPDFEVRVRCARLLAMLCRYWLNGLTNELINDHRSILDDLQPHSLLIDMCRDSSRYVRRVCLDELQDMKLLLGHRYPDLDSGEDRLAKRQAGPPKDHALMVFQKLCAIDFARLEESLTAEHLYQEALDTQVERELMAESKAPNEGNNILDCY